MDKTTERIKADAEDYALPMVWVNQNPKGEEPLFHEYIATTAYIAGAMAENNRAQKLADALEWIKTYGPVDDLTVKFIDNILEQWNRAGKGQFTGSTFTSPAPGITLGCISPEARDLLDTIMEEWEKHYAGMKEMHGAAMPETTFYGFAYWLVRWSGLIQPANTNPTK